MYVTGTLCFMFQAKWTPRCPDKCIYFSRMKMYDLSKFEDEVDANVEVYDQEW